MGDRLTVLLDDENTDWVDTEATERDRSKAYVINEALRAARGEVSTYPVNTAAVNDGEDSTASREAASALAERVDELEARLDAIEDERAHDPSTDATAEPVTRANNAPAREGAENGAVDDESHASRDDSDALTTPAGRPDDGVRALVDAVDWSAVQYAYSERRAAAVADAFATLRDAGHVTTPQLVAVVEAADVDVANPQRLLSDVGGEIDAVRTPPRGSNRYEWVGE